MRHTQDVVGLRVRVRWFVEEYKPQFLKMMRVPSRIHPASRSPIIVVKIFPPFFTRSEDDVTKRKDA